MKVNVYIDGFNLYYAALRGTPYLWLNLRELCERSLPGHDIHRIKYFTAHVKARPRDPNQPVRQQTLLRALRTIPGITIHLGDFRDRTRRVIVAPTDPLAGRRIDALVTEEKGSDVNLATELLIDGFRSDYEAAVVVSDDSDLIAPIRATRQILKLPVGILNPMLEFDRVSGVRRHRKDLVRAATAGDQSTAWFYTHLDHALLPDCLLPDPVVDRNGRRIFKPQSW